MKRGATAEPGARRAANAADPITARRRRAAVLAAIVLPVTMLAPWYSLHVGARGLRGFTQQFSGWDALSASAVVCLIVAVGVCSLIVVRAVRGVRGLGAQARLAAHERTDGALIAAGGLLCTVMLLWTAVAPPSLAVGALTTTTHTTARWGVLVTLLTAVLLTTLGVQMTAAAGRNLRDRRTKRPSLESLKPTQPAPGRSTNENSALSTPTMSMPSTMSQRRRVM